jgi:hypothetical protein
MKYEADAAILDPVYQCVGGQVEHGNLFAMGDLFKYACEELLKVGTTPLLLHHANKRIQLGATMTLDDLAYSGLAEYVRQWILVNRTSEYQGDGVHDIRMAIGGSAGHSSLWDVRVEEGVADENFEGQHWTVEVKSAGEARADAAGKREREKEEAARRKVLAEDAKVLEAIGVEIECGAEAATKNKIVTRCPAIAKKLSTILSRLCEDGVIEEVEFKQTIGNNAKRKVTGFRRPREPMQLYG